MTSTATLVDWDDAEKRITAHDALMDVSREAMMLLFFGPSRRRLISAVCRERFSRLKRSGAGLALPCGGS